MGFLRDIISFVAPRSQLAAALSTRLADLMAVSDPFQLDGVPLEPRLALAGQRRGHPADASRT